MVGVMLQVEAVVELAQQVGFAGARHAAQHDEAALGDRVVDGLQQKAAHRLVAADDARVFDASLVFQPGLADLRAQAAAKTVQVTIGMSAREVGPCRHAPRLDRPADQLVAQGNGRVLAALLVAQPHLLPFGVVHERQVDRAGEGPFAELGGRARVQHGNVAQEKLVVIVGVGAHQTTSTA